MDQKFALIRNILILFVHYIKPLFNIHVCVVYQSVGGHVSAPVYAERRSIFKTLAN